MVEVILDELPRGLRVGFLATLRCCLGQDVLVASVAEPVFATEMVDDQAWADSRSSGYRPDGGAGKSFTAEQADGGVADARPGGEIFCV